MDSKFESPPYLCLISLVKSIPTVLRVASSTSIGTCCTIPTLGFVDGPSFSDGPSVADGPLFIDGPSGTMSKTFSKVGSSLLVLSAVLPPSFHSRGP